MTIDITPEAVERMACILDGRGGFVKDNVVVATLRALSAALTSSQAETAAAWQPIETVPRDGTEILTMRSNGYIRNARWYDNPFGRKDTVIDNADGKWWTVTHWMPLPPPTKGKDRE